MMNLVIKFWKCPRSVLVSMVSFLISSRFWSYKTLTELLKNRFFFAHFLLTKICTDFYIYPWLGKTIIRCITVRLIMVYQSILCWLQTFKVLEDSILINGQISWREALPIAAPSIRHSAYYSASSVISPFQFGSARTRRRIAPFHSTRVELPCVAGFKVSFSGSRPTQSNFMGHLSDNGKWGMFIHQCCVGECFHGVRWRVRWDGAITLCCCGSAEVCCRLPLIISDTFVCVCVC